MDREIIYAPEAQQSAEERRAATDAVGDPGAPAAADAAPDAGSAETDHTAPTAPDDSQNEQDPAQPPANDPPDTDYAALAAADAQELRRLFVECRDLTHIGELEDPIRYAQLRDMGLSVEEAYLATTRRRAGSVPDNRRHLSASVPKGAAKAGVMSVGERRAARELFADLADKEIDELYRRVTEQPR